MLYFRLVIYTNNTANNLDTNTLLDFERLISIEIARRRLTDGCFSTADETIHISELFIRLDTSDTFKDYRQLVEYIAIRSHLYAFDWQTMMVSRRSPNYRRTIINLLSNIYRHKGVLLTKLCQEVCDSGGKYGNRIETIAQDLEKFINFLRDHDQIIELSEEIDNDRLVYVRGTFDVKRDMLLPHQYFQDI
jgi:hypothetical protein